MCNTWQCIVSIKKRKNVTDWLIDQYFDVNVGYLSVRIRTISVVYSVSQVSTGLHDDTHDQVRQRSQQTSTHHFHVIHVCNSPTAQHLNQIWVSLLSSCGEAIWICNGTGTKQLRWRKDHQKKADKNYTILIFYFICIYNNKMAATQRPGP